MVNQKEGIDVCKRDSQGRVHTDYQVFMKQGMRSKELWNFVN